MEYDINMDTYDGVPAFNPKNPAHREQSFAKTIGLTFDKNFITDMTFSENYNYSKTIDKILSKKKKKPENMPELSTDGWGAFNDWVSDWGDPETILTKESIDYYDHKLETGQVKFNDQGEQVEGEYMPGARVWWELKKEGYSPQDLEKEVVQNARQEAMDKQRQVAHYDDLSGSIASTSAQFIGSMGSWLADPVNFTTLAAELGAFAISKSPTTSRVISNFVRKNTKNTPKIKELSKNVTSKIKRRAEQSYRIRRSKAKKKWGVSDKSIDELNAVTEQLLKTHKDYRVVNKILKKRAKEGDFKNIDDIRKLVKGIKKEEVVELGTDAMYYTAFGATAEGIHQYTTYDFKNRVYPEYDKTQAKKDIALSGLFAGGAGIIFDGAAKFIYEVKAGRQVPGFRAESSGELVDSAMKAVSDSSQGKLIDIDPENPPTDFSLDIPEEDIQRQLEVAEGDPDFEPVRQEFNKQMDEFEKARECIVGINNNKSN